MPFRPDDSERPHINYRYVPIRALHELTRMVHGLRERLPEVECPVHLLQADGDPVVDPESVHLIAEWLTGTEPELRMVSAARHGIVPEDLDGTQDYIVARTLELRDGAGPS